MEKTLETSIFTSTSDKSKCVRNTVSVIKILKYECDELPSGRPGFVTLQGRKLFSLQRPDQVSYSCKTKERAVI
jgi:hypothetical protein